MNTELRLDHNISSSNKHDKSAKDNRITDLVKLLDMAEIIICRPLCELDALTTE